MEDGLKSKKKLQAAFESASHPELQQFCHSQDPPFGVLLDLLKEYWQDSATRVRYVNRGKSGAGVLLFLPDEGIPKVVKFGKRSIIEKEFRNFDKYVKERLPPDCAAYSFDDKINEVNEFGAFSYTWASGYERAEQIRSIIAERGAGDKIAQSVMDLMSPVFRWYQPKSTKEDPFDLWGWRKRADYRIRETLDRFHNEPGYRPLISFLRRAPDWRSKLSVSKFARARQCHGDLNCHNVVISAIGSSWKARLIDFGSVCRGKSPAYDWSKLERDLKYKSLLDACEGDSLRFAKVLHRVDAALDAEESTRDRFADIDENKIKTAAQNITTVIRRLRSEYITLARNISDLPLTEYLCHVLNWSLAFLDQESYHNDDIINRAVVGSAFAVYQSIESSTRFGSAPTVDEPIEPERAAFSRDSCELPAAGRSFAVKSRDLDEQASYAQLGSPSTVPTSADSRTLTDPKLASDKAEFSRRLLQRWRYAEMALRVASQLNPKLLLLASGLGIVILLSATFLWLRAPSSHHPSISLNNHDLGDSHHQMRILVARFSGDGQQCGLRESIIREVDHIKGPHDDLWIGGADQVIEEANRPEIVENLGRQENADVVIWGQCDASPDGGFAIHVTPITSFAQIDLQKPSMIGAIRDIQGFAKKRDEARKINSLALTILGLSRAYIDPQGAIEAFNRALEQPTPDDMMDRGELFLFLASAQASLYQTDNALDSIESGLKSTHNSQMEEGLRALRAMLYLRRGESQKATSDCQGIVESNHRGAIWECGAVYAAMGDLASAQFAFRRAVEIKAPTTAVDHLWIASVYGSMCKVDIAERELNTAAALDPKNDNLTGMRIFLRYQQHDPTLLDSLPPPQNAVSYLFRAKLYRERGKADLAKKDIEAASKSMWGISGWLNIYTESLLLGDVEGASRALDRALALNPSSPELLKSRAYILAAEKSPAALEVIERVLALRPRDADALLTKAGLLFDNNGDDAGEAALSAALRSQPTFAAAYFLKGDHEMTRGRFEPAMVAYGKAIDLISNPQAHYFGAAPLQDLCDEHMAAQRLTLETLYRAQHARAALALGKYDIAEHDLDLKHIDANDAGVFILRSELADARGDLQTAIKEIDTALRLNPNLIIVYTRQGNLLKKAKRTEEAIAAYEYALKLDSKNVAALEGEADVYTDKGNWRKVENIYQTLMNSNPDTASYAFNHAFALHRMGNAEDAMRSVDAAVAKWPNYHSGLNVRAIIYCETRRIKEAVADYQRLLHFVTSSALYYSNAAACFEVNGDYLSAEHAYKRATILESGNDEYWNNLAKFYLRYGKYEEAVATYTLAIKSTSHSAHLYAARASILSSEARSQWFKHEGTPNAQDTRLFRRAMDDLQFAISKEPENAVFYKSAFNLCFELMSLCGNDKGKHYIDEAIRLEPNNPDLFLARVPADASVAERIADVSRSLQIREDSIAYLRRAQEYQQERDFPRALADITNAIRLSPKQAYAYQMRSEVYEEMNRLDDALKDIGEVYRIDGSIDAIIEKARLLTKKGEMSQALADLEITMRDNSNRLELYEARGNVYYLAHKIDAAVRDYKQAAALVESTANKMKKGRSATSGFMSARWVQRNRRRLIRKAAQARNSTIDLKSLWSRF